MVAALDRWQRFILLKLLTGEFRVGVSQTLVVRALAQAAGSLPATTIAARLMGDWTPTATGSPALLSHGVTNDDRSRPYPFFLAVADSRTGTAGDARRSRDGRSSGNGTASARSSSSAPGRSISGRAAKS